MKTYKTGWPPSVQYAVLAGASGIGAIALLTPDLHGSGWSIFLFSALIALTTYLAVRAHMVRGQPGGLIGWLGMRLEDGRRTGLRQLDDGTLVVCEYRFLQWIVVRRACEQDLDLVPYKYKSRVIELLSAQGLTK